MEEDKNEEKVDLSQLSNLDFAPNWNNKYADDNQQRTKHEPRRRERQKESRNRKKELPKRYDSQFTNKFKVTVSPNNKILDTLKKGIKKSGISYSLEEINAAIIDKKDRLKITIENLKKQDSFFITKFDNSVFDTKLNAVKHIIDKGLKHVVDITETIGESPNGNFKNILKCTATQILLPPKSFHDFEAIIKTHLIENNIKFSYDKYVDSLQLVEDELTISEWKNKPLKKLVYTTKGLNNKRTFNKIDGIQRYISSIETNEFIETNNIINIEGDNIDRLGTNLRDFISNFLRTTYQWKKDLFFNILINFKKSGFYIFKYGPKSFLFASGPKHKPIEITKISENCVKIVNIIKLNKSVKILTILSQSEQIELDKNQILLELKWLVKEGYIREFSDGTVSC
jgi:hypothetical protein